MVTPINVPKSTSEQKFKSLKPLELWELISIEGAIFWLEVLDG